MRQFWLLTRMSMWVIFIRVLKPLVPVKRLVAIAAPRMSKKTYAGNDVLRNMQWFSYFNLTGKDGDCLIKALTLFRFLSFTERKPTMIIGFQYKKGHAWVEVQGELVREAEDTPLIYKPILVLNSGSRSLTLVQ